MEYLEMSKRTSFQRRVPEENNMQTMSASVKRRLIRALTMPRSQRDDYHLLPRKQQVILVRLRTGQTEQSYARQTEAGTNLTLWSRRTNHRARSTKMPPSKSYKRRRVASQHFPDDQTLRLQTGAGKDDIHLPSGLDRVDCERQEED